ncbi:unnamed protein product [Prorocentrum cordatum]|uniref:Uncharacterized protein n=1 Tax=Prorocentrum cordatum TaxID=2364126 RepID=A0ABN9V4Z9_9DINO|nr:unnamed protein product [Polarella glacialis]
MCFVVCTFRAPRRARPELGVLVLPHPFQGKGVPGVKVVHFAELEAERSALGGSCCTGGQQCGSLDGIGVAVPAEAMQSGGGHVGKAGSGPEVVCGTCDTQANVMLGAPDVWPSAAAAEAEFGGAEVLRGGGRGGTGPTPGTWHVASPFAEAKAFAAGFASGWSLAERDAAQAERVGAASQTVEESAMLVRPCGLPGGLSAVDSHVVAVDACSGAEGFVDGGVASDDEWLRCAGVEADTACSAVPQQLLGAAAASYLEAHPAAFLSRSKGLHEAGEVLQASGAVVLGEAGAALAAGSLLKRYQEEQQGMAIEMAIVGGLDVGAQLGGLANERRCEDSEAPVSQQEVEEASDDDGGKRVKQSAWWAARASIARNWLESVAEDRDGQDVSVLDNSVSGSELLDSELGGESGDYVGVLECGEEAPLEAVALLTVTPEPTVHVVLQGQRMNVPKPAADYLLELEHAARERRLSPLDVEEIVSFSLAGEAAIRDAIEAGGETDFFDEMGYEAEAGCCLTRWGSPAA